MIRSRMKIVLMSVPLLVLVAWSSLTSLSETAPPDREEVVFWHFWSGPDADVVADVVTRFNRSQDRYYVRAISMPGNNFDMKLFLAITGGDPPDLINQDDPIVADWAERGAIMSMEEIVPPDEVAEFRDWLLPAAVRLGLYRNRCYAVCNGLDIRALYYNADLVESALGTVAPTELRDVAHLDEIAERCNVYDSTGDLQQVGYLPDPRRLWAWGVVFGGEFIDTRTSRIRASDPQIVAALQWMVGYRDRLGAGAVAKFRQNDQSLPNKMFPLLAGRHAIIMDGQWRVRDIVQSQAASRRTGQMPTRYGVWRLPADPAQGGRDGWVNGNVFMVPRGARQPRGAWEFIKFWCGYGGQVEQAAQTCIAGGWIPVSDEVCQSADFVQYLEANPLFARFVELSQTDQVPTPVIPGAARYYREVNNAVQQLMYSENPPTPTAVLERVELSVQQAVDQIRESRNPEEAP